MDSGRDIVATQFCDALLAGLQTVSWFRVHSVFQRACNIQTPQGRLWVVQARGMPLAPAGIVTDCADLRPFFSVGERLYWRGESCLCGTKALIELRSAMPISTRLEPCGDVHTLGRLAAEIAAFFSHQPEKGIRQALLTDATLKHAQTSLVHWLRTGEGELNALLMRFIGRGEGLTPAGDDFLLGVSLVLNHWRFARAATLNAALPPLLDRTTDISRAMLEQGCDSRYSAQLLALATGNSETCPQAIARVADYGHSSGHDMLAGILTAAHALA
ncbi:DUF2877 domain-containing protein [Phytobacter ursingii]|uniref:DUF2877 domain-containing protein n=1 Tax=Phytobacter ursingii TaxID=1972431 RepID=UPI000CD2EAC7|nr:hypothetical protein C2U51_22915 [Enterobacteriaceae bacterium ENNIH1]